MGNMGELTKNMENIEQKFLVYHEFFIIYYNDGEWGICRMGIHTNSRIFRDLQRRWGLAVLPDVDSHEFTNSGNIH